MVEAVTPSESTTEDQIERLLDFVATISVVATSSQFIVKEKFVRDTGNDAKVKINYLNYNFTK